MLAGGGGGDRAGHARWVLGAAQVNAAVEQLATHAETNARWMAAVRTNAVSRIPADERKRATELFHTVAVGCRAPFVGCMRCWVQHTPRPCGWLGSAGSSNCTCWVPALRAGLHAAAAAAARHGHEGLRGWGLHAGGRAPAQCPPPPALQSREGVKGRFWFLEQDLKAGTVVKLDKSGRNLLMTLRHLGRIAEVGGPAGGPRGRTGVPSRAAQRAAPLPPWSDTAQRACPQLVTG